MLMHGSVSGAVVKHEGSKVPGPVYGVHVVGADASDADGVMVGVGLSGRGFAKTSVGGERLVSLVYNAWMNVFCIDDGVKTY